MMTLTEYKAEFKDRLGIQFNNAGMAPISNRVTTRALQTVSELNRLGAFTDKNFLPALTAGRERLAHFLAADTAEISYFQNCASALSQIAFSLALTPKDSVVTLDQEYASNFYPWREACSRAGAKLIVVNSEASQQVRMESLLGAIHPGIMCVSISWVQFQTGALIDLKKLGNHCHSVGAKLVVDGIQGIGQLPISFRDLPVDALIGGSHKWLCSLNGQAFMAVKKEWLEALPPVLVGAGTFNRWSNFGDSDAPMEQTARKFEPGGLNFVGLFALDEAIALQQEVGITVIADEISRLSQIFRKGLLQFEKKGLALATPLDQAGGITSFQLPLEAEAKFLMLCQQEQVGILKRGAFLRSALHAFNEESEIQRVLELIQQACD